MFRTTALLAILICPNIGFAEDHSEEGDFSIDYECVQMWISRNNIFDQAGQCFSSDLGVAFFDNSDCTTDDPTLDAAQVATVQRIRTQEAELGCNALRSSYSLEYFSSFGIFPSTSARPTAVPETELAEQNNSNTLRPLIFGAFESSVWFMPEGLNGVELIEFLQSEGFETEVKFNGLLVQDDGQIIDFRSFRTSFTSVQNAPSDVQFAFALSVENFFLHEYEIVAEKGDEALRYKIVGSSFLRSALYEVSSYFDKQELRVSLVEKFGDPAEERGNADLFISLSWNCTSPDPILNVCPYLRGHAQNQDYSFTYGSNVRNIAQLNAISIDLARENAEEYKAENVNAVALPRQ